MELTLEQRQIIKAAKDLDARRKLRMALPDGVRSLCAAYTERHTECKRTAREGSRYCGQHQKTPNARSI